MDNYNIIVIDDYIEDIGKQIQKKGEDIQNGINKYVTLLDEILLDGIVFGDTADAIRKFADYARMLLNIVSPIGETYNALCSQYLSAIDEADDELY